MERVFTLAMEVRTMNEKGFSLLSMLLVLMVLTSLSLLTIKRAIFLEDKHLSMINDYFDMQIESLTKKQRNSMNDYNIHFNKSGRVNQARSIDINGHHIIIHLGNGYLTYE